MNIQFQIMAGFGPTAWNHGSQAITIPSMLHHQERNNGNGGAKGRKSSTQSSNHDHLAIEANLVEYANQL